MDAILETTLDIFKGWLQSFTLRWPGSVEQLSDDKYFHTIRRMRERPWVGNGQRIDVYHCCTGVLDGDVETLSLEHPCIVATIETLAPERQRLTLQCQDDRALPLYDAMIEEIAKNWPEVVAGATIGKEGASVGRLQSKPPGRKSDEAYDATLEERDAGLLVQQLRKQYNIPQLRQLAFEVGVDHEDIPSETKTDLARELVLYCQRQGRLAVLERKVREERPDLDW